MAELTPIENTLHQEALRRRVSFRQFIAKYPFQIYEKGQIIMLQNETPPGVFVIESGRAKSYTIEPNGYEQLISIHSRGEDIPVGYAFGLVGKAQYFYEAYTKCTLRIIPRDEFLEHVHADIDLMQQLHSHNLEQLLSALSRIHALGQPRASNKVALTLIYLADRLGFKPWARPKFMEISVTQDEIAKLLGMTRETVGYELKKLRFKKLISYSRKNYILYLDRIRGYIKGRR